MGGTASIFLVGILYAACMDGWKGDQCALQFVYVCMYNVSVYTKEGEKGATDIIQSVGEEEKERGV